MAEKEHDELLARAKTLFAQCEEDPADNRASYEEDTRFVRSRDQWPSQIQKMREDRPCLTIDKLGPVIRQVVNDARQNKPAVKVQPIDSNADPETADVLAGLIRNIEEQSNADVAYDTAVECAVGGGFGYWRIKADYAYADAFDMDLCVERIPNPLCVFPDPNSTAADSSDWDTAFIVDRLTKDEYEDKYGGEEQVDWSSDAWKGIWLNDEGVLVAEWWEREEYEKTIVQLSDGSVYDKEKLAENTELQVLLEGKMLTIAGERQAKCHRVTQRIMSGSAILETNKWPGRYIPIIPVYGDEYWIDGKRYLRSLINGAKDAQQMFNVMRSTAVELWGLSPKVPYLLEEGAADADPNWATANKVGHPYLEYAKGSQTPVRQMMDPGVASGAMNEALAASDDIKAITGIQDASLGIASNETSGRAIMARQREGDVSTFHFIDNLRRSIRHTGRVLIDLIPHFYSKARIIRVIGADSSEETVQVNQPYEKQDKMGNVVMAMHDLTVGKYDVAVTSGPSFTTRREEAAYSMTEALRAFPMGADVIVPELAKVLDWPGSDKIAEKLEQKMSGQLPPEVQKMIEQGKEMLAQKDEEIAQLRGDKSEQQAELMIKVRTAQAELESKEEIARLEIESEERIAQMKIASEANLAAYKARLMAEVQANRPQPQRAA